VGGSHLHALVIIDLSLFRSNKSKYYLI
jgi:hypothetical protein